MAVPVPLGFFPCPVATSLSLCGPSSRYGCLGSVKGHVGVSRRTSSTPVLFEALEMEDAFEPVGLWYSYCYLRSFTNQVLTQLDLFEKENAVCETELYRRLGRRES